MSCKLSPGQRSLPALSQRLLAVAGLVSPGKRLVDVGTDHAYLPVWLVKQGKCPSAIAMDLREGPLSRARDHVREYGLEDRIELRLGDGLAALKPGEGQSLVLSGMGGLLMERILTQGALVRESLEELVLQPQSDQPHLRRFLTQIGWKIEAEDMVLEDNKFYPMLRAVPACAKPPTPSLAKALQTKADPYNLEERFGPCLLRQRHPVLLRFLLREEGLHRKIEASLAQSTGPAAEARRREIGENLEKIQEAKILFSNPSYSDPSFSDSSFADPFHA